MGWDTVGSVWYRGFLVFSSNSSINYFKYKCFPGYINNSERILESVGCALSPKWNKFTLLTCCNDSEASTQSLKVATRYPIVAKE